MRPPAALALVVVLGVGCAIGPEAEPEPIRLPEDGLTVPLAPTAPVDHDAETLVSLFLVDRDGIVRVTRVVRAPAGAAAVLDALLTAPTAAERTAGLGTAIPAGTGVRGVDVAEGIARVDLSQEFTRMGGSESILAVAQVVLSLTGLDEVDAVEFTIVGDQTSVPTADGELRDGPVDADDYTTLIASP